MDVVMAKEKSLGMAILLSSSLSSSLF